MNSSYQRSDHRRPRATVTPFAGAVAHATVASQDHADYGLSYPVTYVFAIPTGQAGSPRRSA